MLFLRKMPNTPVPSKARIKKMTELKFWGEDAANSLPLNLAALIADLSQAPIDWDTAPAAVSTGSLVGMPDEFVLLVDMLVRNEALVQIATQLGLDPIALAIGLLARAQAKHSRTAARIASALLPPGIDAEGIHL